MKWMLLLSVLMLQAESCEQQHYVVYKWDPVPSATYRVYRSPCVGLVTPGPTAGVILSPGARVGTCQEGQRAFFAPSVTALIRDESVLAGRAYSYCVTSVVAGQESECSATAAAQIPPD